MNSDRPGNRLDRACLRFGQDHFAPDKFYMLFRVSEHFTSLVFPTTVFISNGSAQIHLISGSRVVHGNTIRVHSVDVARSQTSFKHEARDGGRLALG